MRAGLGLALSLVVLALPAGSAAEPTWLPSLVLSPVGQDSNLPQVASDRAGDVFVVWQRYNGVNEVVDSIHRPAGGAWAAPHEFSIVGQTLSGPQIAVNPAGDAVAVWTRWAGASTVVQAARRPAGGDLSDAQDISVLAEDSGAPKVAVDPSGTATAIWEARSGSTSVVETSRQPAGGSWSAPEIVSAAGSEAEAPDLAVDAAGNATAVWERSAAGSNWIVQAASRPADGSWSAPQDLSTEAVLLVPKVAVDRAGDAVAVWLRSTWVVRASERPAGGSWGAPRSLSGGEASQPEVAMGSARDAVAVWARFDGANQIVQARRRAARGGWRTQVDLSAKGQDARAPQVALDDAGSAVAVWVRFNDAGKQIVQTARQSEPEAWDTTHDLSPPGGDAGDPQVAVDPAGNAVAAWDVSDESHTNVEAAGLDAAGPNVNGFSIPTRGTAGKRLSFSVSPGLDVWSTLSGAPHWFFGDGASASGTTVTHVFRAGSYNVTVSQADRVGNQTSAHGTVTISPAPCVVPRVLGLTLVRARAAIKRRHCRTGRVVRAFSKKVTKGRVLAQRPRAGKHLAPGARVKLVVSRGKRR